MIKIVECPRDAMQGWKQMIPTDKKIDYINSLLKVGFDTIDFGSFVSAAAIPQMADTAKVISQLDMSSTTSKLLAIVANKRGADEARHFEQISFLGFPFSVSPTFQQRNTNSSQEESLKRIDDIQNICLSANKKLVVYLSMGFGNPYGDAYNEEVLLQWAAEMANRHIEIISLADTVGMANASQIEMALNTLIPEYPNIEIGVHLHSTPSTIADKLKAAVGAGCTRFDGALMGIGGCPMASDTLTGNMNTETMLSIFEELNVAPPIDEEALNESLRLAAQIFV